MSRVRESLMPIPTRVTKVDHMARNKGTRRLGIPPVPSSGTDPIRLLAHWALAICLAPALLAALLVGGLALVIQQCGRFASSAFHLAARRFR
ncbi:hypothetical protein V5E97_34895 [Singulisphaera sp. Ch08]|uniref:Uncharacterized protein n=1 Tax=Singulisphaera sp. Ch08 TaxID=3120278 RepID=A0AAU7CEE8_9BACT